MMPGEASKPWGILQDSCPGFREWWLPFMRAALGSPRFLFMYRCLFEVLRLILSFTVIQCDLFEHLNVAISQLHPNSSTMVRAFEILCPFFNIWPNVSIFLYFFQMNLMEKIGWVSLNNMSNKLFKFDLNISRCWWLMVCHLCSTKMGSPASCSIGRLIPPGLSLLRKTYWPSWRGWTRSSWSYRPYWTRGSFYLFPWRATPLLPWMVNVCLVLLSYVCTCIEAWTNTCLCCCCSFYRYYGWLCLEVTHEVGQTYTRDCMTFCCYSHWKGSTYYWGWPCCYWYHWDCFQYPFLCIG